MQRRQRATAYESGEKSAESKHIVGAREMFFSVLLTKNHPTEVQDHGDEKISRSTE